MTVTRRWRDIWKFLVPGWLQKGQGELVQYAEGLVLDAYAQRMHETAQLHNPSICVEDALDYHGRSRGLPRGIFEPETQYRERLIGWRYPKGHRVRGTAGALLEQFEIALRGTQHVIVDARNNRTESGTYPTISGPTFVGVSVAGDAAAIVVTWPPHVKYDVALLFVASSNQAVATPTGFTLLATDGVGAAGNTNSVAMFLFMRIAQSSSESDVAIADSGTGQRAALVVYRAANPNAPVLADAAGAGPDVDDVTAFAGTTNIDPGENHRIVAAFASGNFTVTFSGYVNVSGGLTFTERSDVGSSPSSVAVAVADAPSVLGQFFSQARANMAASGRYAGATAVLAPATNTGWNWDGLGASPLWARYWLVCHSVGTPWASFSDPAWLAAWNDPTAALAGSGVEFGELDAVRKLASDRSLGWTPAGVEPNTLVMYFGSDPFPEPGGNWTAWANRDSRYRYVSLHPTVS
jgi:hypothetical protein